MFPNMTPLRSLYVPRPALSCRSLRQGWLAAAVLGLVMLSGCAGQSAPLEMPYPAPIQKPIRPGEVVLEPSAQGVRFVPRAKYFTQAYVMRTERYRWDPLSETAPVDFALAWGAAARPELQNALEISQSGRWYYWKLAPGLVKNAPSVAELNRSMANVHMVGASPAIQAVLDGVEQGQTIQASGYLVDLLHDEAAKSRTTSLTRTDTGAGSCEIFYVTDIRVIEPVS